MSERSLIYTWFTTVSILSVVIMSAATYEKSLIILNAFIAPFSIIIYFVGKFFYEEFSSEHKGVTK